MNMSLRSGSIRAREVGNASFAPFVRDKVPGVDIVLCCVGLAHHLMHIGAILALHAGLENLVFISIGYFL